MQTFVAGELLEELPAEVVVVGKVLADSVETERGDLVEELPSDSSFPESVCTPG